MGAQRILLSLCLLSCWLVFQSNNLKKSSWCCCLAFPWSRSNFGRLHPYPHRRALSTSFEWPKQQSLQLQYSFLSTSSSISSPCRWQQPRHRLHATRQTSSSTTTTPNTTTTPTTTDEDWNNNNNKKKTKGRKQNIVIVGSGAVGCYYGARLWETSQFNVMFYMRPGEHYDKCSQEGLKVTSVFGDVEIPPRELQVYNDTNSILPSLAKRIEEEEEEKVEDEQEEEEEDKHNQDIDWILVSLKSTSLQAIPELVYPLLHPTKTKLLVIMNGLIEDDLIEMLNTYHHNHNNDNKSNAAQPRDDDEEEETTTVATNNSRNGKKKDDIVQGLNGGGGGDSDSGSASASTRSLHCCKALYGGMALVCCNRLKPGHVDHSYAGKLSGGVAACHPNFHVEDQEFQDEFENLWKSTNIPFAYEPCLLAGRWRKNVWNLPFNGVSVAMGGITVDRIVTDPGLRHIANKVMDETIKIANTDLEYHGCTPTQSNGNDKDDDSSNNNCNKPRIYNLGDADKEAMFELSDNMGPYRTSTMIDLIERRPMEVQYLFRKPLERAYALGLEVPYLETLVLQIEAYQKQYNLF